MLSTCIHMLMHARCCTVQDDRSIFNRGYYPVTIVMEEQIL